MGLEGLGWGKRCGGVVWLIMVWELGLRCEFGIRLGCGVMAEIMGRGGVVLGLGLGR